MANSFSRDEFQSFSENSDSESSSGSSDNEEIVNYDDSIEPVPTEEEAAALILGTANSRGGGRADFVESFFWRKRSYRLVCSCLVYCITTTGMLCKCDARESASIFVLALI